MLTEIGLFPITSTIVACHSCLASALGALSFQNIKNIERRGKERAIFLMRSSKTLPLLATFSVSSL